MTPRIRPSVAVIAGATLTVVLAGAGLRSVAAPPATLAAALRAPPTRGPGDYQAHLVVQPSDCDGNVHVLRFLRRAPIRARVTVAEVLLVGSHRDFAAVRRRVGDAPDGIPMRRADDRTVRALRTIGYRSTPFLVIAERGGGVKMTLQLPSTPEEVAAFARLLPHLAPVAPSRRSSL